MSVSTLNTPVPASSTPDLSQTNAGLMPNASRAAPAAQSFHSHHAAHFTFHSSAMQGGPVFGGQQQATAHQHHASHFGHQHSAPAKPPFFQPFTQWMNHWFNGNRPSPQHGINHPPHGSFPMFGGRPDPHDGINHPPHGSSPMFGGRPDLGYALKSHEDLAGQLLGKFNAFQDPKHPGSISADSIRAMAQRGWSPFSSVRENIRLAKELMRRPDLMSALDRQVGTGRLDGLIDRNSLNAVINGDNDFKFTTDKELAGEMLEHFNELIGGPWTQSIKIRDLTNLAAESLTGDAHADHVIQLAREVMQRSDVMNRMDSVGSIPGDHRISWAGLYLLSH